MIDQDKIRQHFGDDAKLAFYQYSRQNYAGVGRRGSVVDELMIGIYHDEGGSTAEFCIELVDLSNSLSLRLCMFDDAWKLFPHIGEITNLLIKSEDVLWEDFVFSLISIGVIDKSDKPFARLNSFKKLVSK